MSLAVLCSILARQARNGGQAYAVFVVLEDELDRVFGVLMQCTKAQSALERKQKGHKGPATCLPLNKLG